MRGGRFLSCRHGAMGVVHLVVVHGPGHGVDFSGIVCFVERFPRKEKKKFQRFFFIILGENLACTFFFFTKDDLKDFFFIILTCAHFVQPQKTLRSHRYSCPNSE